MASKSIFYAARVANESLDAWLPDHAVVVEDDLISSVAPKGQLPSDHATTHEVHDLGDVSLLPGLVDAHCHMHCSATPDAYELVTTETDQQLTIRAIGNMRRCLLAGTTTIRDIGSKNEVAFAVKQAVDQGLAPGPRMLVSGTPITITAGHCWFFSTEADTTDQVVTAVRHQVKLGAEVIKMMATGGMFTPTANPRRVQYGAETLAAAVAEAERMNVQIVAHTLSADGVRNCVEAGIHHIIHARWHHSDFSKGLDYDSGVVKQMADNGQWVDPTLGHIILAEEAASSGRAPKGKVHWAVTATAVPIEEHVETLSRMSEAGVRFTAGLDMGMAHGTHDRSAANAWAYSEWLGWDNWRCIRTSTADTAEAIRVGHQVGRIRPGLVADLAAFKGDPAASIRDLDQADSVIKGGELVKMQGQALV